MSFKFNNSEWNLENELRCFVIFKELEHQGFPKGRQTELAREMAKKTNLEVGNISAKISNYKSEAGINSPSNSSTATQEIYRKYGILSLSEAKAIYEGFRLCREQHD